MSGNDNKAGTDCKTWRLCPRSRPWRKHEHKQAEVMLAMMVVSGDVSNFTCGIPRLTLYSEYNIVAEPTCDYYLYLLAVARQSQNLSIEII